MILLFLLSIYVSQYIKDHWLRKTNIAKSVLEKDEIWWERGIFESIEMMSVTSKFFVAITKKSDKVFSDYLFILSVASSFILLSFFIVLFIAFMLIIGSK